MVVKPRYDIDPLGRQYTVLLSVLMSGFIECYGQEWYDHESSAVKVVQMNFNHTFAISMSTRKIELNVKWNMGFVSTSLRKHFLDR